MVGVRLRELGIAAECRNEGTNGVVHNIHLEVPWSTIIQEQKHGMLPQGVQIRI